MRNFSLLTRKETRRLMFGHVTRDAQGGPSETAASTLTRLQLDSPPRRDSFDK